MAVADGVVVVVEMVVDMVEVSENVEEVKGAANCFPLGIVLA